MILILYIILVDVFTLGFCLGTITKNKNHGKEN